MNITTIAANSSQTIPPLGKETDAARVAGSAASTVAQVKTQATATPADIHRLGSG
jgi:hypothetical protein